MKKTQVEYRCQDQKNNLSSSEMPSVSLQDERVHQQRKGQKDETYYRDQDIGVQNMEEVREEPKENNNDSGKRERQYREQTWHAFKILQSTTFHLLNAFDPGAIAVIASIATDRF